MYTHSTAQRTIHCNTVALPCVSVWNIEMCTIWTNKRVGLSEWSCVHKDTHHLVCRCCCCCSSVFRFVVAIVVVCTTHEHMSEAVVRSHTHTYRWAAYMHKNNRLCVHKRREHIHIGRHRWAHMPYKCTLTHSGSTAATVCKPLFSLRFGHMNTNACALVCERVLLAYSNAVYCPIVLQPYYFLWCTFCWCCCRTIAIVIIVIIIIIISIFVHI